jgi:hypothetical protein
MGSHLENVIVRAQEDVLASNNKIDDRQEGDYTAVQRVSLKIYKLFVNK